MCILALLPMVIMASDFITYVDGERIEVSVIKVGVGDVHYRKASNPDGPVYVERKSRILRIDYENGTSDNFMLLKNSRGRLTQYDRSKWELEMKMTLKELRILDVLMGYNVNNHLRVGGGVGYGGGYYGIHVMPLYVNARYTVLNTRVAPYLQTSHGLCVGDSNGPSPYANLSGGAELRLKRGSAFIELGADFHGKNSSNQNAFIGFGYIRFLKL